MLRAAMLLGLQNGTIFAGRYKVLRCIAAGGMGAVYEVLHLETERRRALKVMLPHMLDSAELRDRFKREARVAARVESEFIVDVFDAGVDDATDMPFLVMELLRGEELSHRLRRQGRLTPGEVVTYLSQAALALDKTHKASIVHRDLKPENLFLTEREEGLPRIKVLDFGVAKLLAASAAGTAGTQTLGTPAYMSPEQFNPEIPLTAAADIYALGMMAYTLLVGAAYWDEEMKKHESVITFALVAVHGPKEAATARAARKGAALPKAFDAWFARATALDPKRRFPTATGAVSALAEALGMVSARASLSLEQGGAPSSSPGRGAPASEPRPASGIMAAETPMAPAPTPIGTVLPREQTGRHPDRLVNGALALGVVVGGAVVFLWWRSGTSPTSGAERAVPVTPVAATLPAPSAATAVAATAASSALAVPMISPSAAPAVSAAAPVKATGKPAPPRPAAPAPRKEPKPERYSQD